MSRTRLDLTAPLPTSGHVLVDASAGTGKTYAVAGIITRLVIEQGVRTDQLLVTTFTRAAARELKDRIRGRLVDAVRCLETGVNPGGDPIATAILSDAAPAERQVRLAAARAAVADFEAATIGTIHSLCQRILRLAGQDVPLDAEPIAAADLIGEVINDLQVAAGLGKGTPVDEEALADAVEQLLANPTATLWVNDEGDSGLVEARQTLARCVDLVRQRQDATLTYDGLLHRAHQLLTDAANHDLRALLHERYRVAIVDEAQDTDPLQWELLQALVPPDDPGRTLYVVGDAKQSIYAFRGADVDGYVRARAHEATHLTLDTNYRSDQPLLDGLNALLAGARFGAGIEYAPVQAPPSRQTSALPSGVPPIEVLVLPASMATVSERKQAVASCVASRVREVIDAGQCQAQEIAVLVGDRWEATGVAHALAKVGVSAVTQGTMNVLATDAASIVQHFLQAVDQPTDRRRVRRSAIEWFGDLTAATLAADDGDGLLAFTNRLADAGRLLRAQGVAAMVTRLLRDERVIARMAATGTLERHLTDLLHISELLHEATGRRGTNPGAVLSAIGTLQALEARAELVTRRLESDADAVQVMTIHAAKGLQFPYVIVAKHWGDPTTAKRIAESMPIGRFGEDDGQRRADCGWYVGRADEASVAAVRKAAAGEDARLFYVAVTRAEHRLLVVLPPDDLEKGVTTPSRVLRLADPVVDAESVSRQLAERLGGLLDSTVRIIGPEQLLEALPARMTPPRPTGDASAIVAAPPPSPVRAPMLRWSFSTMTAKRHQQPVEAPQAGDDEYGAADPAIVVATAPSPLATLPAGADVGTMMHDLLERLDFTVPDPVTELHRLMARDGGPARMRSHHEALALGLTDVLRTPLGEAPPLDFSLAQVARADRLDELGFDLTLAAPDLDLRLRAVGALLLDALPVDDPLRPWAERLRARRDDLRLAGMLNGFIDLVVRHPLRRKEFLIIDYKSNRLPSYDASALLRSMEEHQYLLQGLLYSVAVHRWLRWRTGEADPSARLTGFAYLYVRGMSGPATPIDATGGRHGVFHWRAPAGLIPALSDLLAGEHVA